MADGPNAMSPPVRVSTTAMAQPDQRQRHHPAAKGQREAEDQQGQRGQQQRIGALLVECARGVLDQPPRDLEEEQSDGELDPADHRPWEESRGEIDQAGPAQHDEYDPHEQSACCDRVGSKSLRDRDRAEGLERLDRHGEPVDDRHQQIEGGRRQKCGCCRKTVGDDEHGRDRHEDTEVGHGAGQLAPIEAHRRQRRRGDGRER